MKLTKSQLKQIIKEELESTIEEGALGDWVRSLAPKWEKFLWGKSKVSTFDPASEKEEPKYTIVFQTPLTEEAEIWDPGESRPGIPAWNEAGKIYRPVEIIRHPTGLAIKGAYDEDELASEIAAIQDLSKKVNGVNFIVAYETTPEALKIVQMGERPAVNAVLENPKFNSPRKSALGKATGGGAWPQAIPDASPLGGDTAPLQRIAERERMLKQIIKEELVQVLRESQRAA